jgi:hypothetical protein
MPVESQRPATLVDGAPRYGQLAWVSEREVVVISAGKNRRWEKFKLEQVRVEGGRVEWRLEFVGWKPFAVDIEGD